MSTYAIGDVQGCFSALTRLVKQIQFDPAHDQLWFVGDLVNRGPDSLGVLRWVKALNTAAVAVLGNHDLHLLAAAETISPLRRDDTISEILRAPDRHELLDWLRHRPLLHADHDFVMVHAGLLPQWSVEQAAALAAEAEYALQGNGYRQLLQQVSQKNAHPQTRWSDELTGQTKLGLVVKALTRLRVCAADGDMDFSYKGPLAHIPRGLLPWFHVPNRKNADRTIVCGHWAALGFHAEQTVLALDSGCVWGGKLTAVRLEDRHVFQVSCAE